MGHQERSQQLRFPLVYSPSQRQSWVPGMQCVTFKGLSRLRAG